MSKISLPDSMGIIYDGTQTLGLIASGVLENPLENINNIVLIGGAHKTLPAPACGLIMTNCSSYQQCLQTNITPKYLRNTQPNHIAALLLALIEQENLGKSYQTLTVKIANQLAEELSILGFNVAKLKSNKYTYTHQLFILMSQSGINSLTSPPAKTASPLSTRIATAVPNIISLNLYLEVRAISMSWVLSPISAINSVKNTFKNNNIF